MKSNRDLHLSISPKEIWRRFHFLIPISIWGVLDLMVMVKSNASMTFSLLSLRAISLDRTDYNIALLSRLQSNQGRSKYFLKMFLFKNMLDSHSAEPFENIMKANRYFTYYLKGKDNYRCLLFKKY